MAKLDSSQNFYYPSPTKTGPLHDDFRQLFDAKYEMQRQLADLTARTDAAHNRIGEMSKRMQEAMGEVNGPSNTKITGLNVQAVPPQQGTSVASLSGTPVLGYNPASGQIEWFVPA